MLILIKKKKRRGIFIKNALREQSDRRRPGRKIWEGFRNKYILNNRMIFETGFYN
jgi:hypothetical protein